jgi:hypothetical protein
MKNARVTSFGKVAAFLSISFAFFSGQRVVHYKVVFFSLLHFNAHSSAQI